MDFSQMLKWRYAFLLLACLPIVTLGISFVAFELFSECDNTAKINFLRMFDNSTEAALTVGGEIRAKYVVLATAILMYSASTMAIIVSLVTIRRCLRDDQATMVVGIAATLSVFVVSYALVSPAPGLPFCAGKILFEFPQHALTDGFLPSNSDTHSWPSWPSTNGWINILANIFGIFATNFAIFAVAATLASGVRNGSNVLRNANLAGQMKCLRNVLFSGTGMLVAAVLSLGSWLRWPAALVTDQTAQRAILDWATGLTLFWGSTFTLILLTTYIPATLCLQARAHKLCLQQYSDYPISVQERWLESRGLAIGQKMQIATILAIAGPLLTGALSSVLHTAIGGSAP